MTFSLYHPLARADLERRTGSLDQVGGATLMAYADGPARGMQLVQARTGAGLAFEILTDRGMGLGNASVFGIPINWVSAAGPVAPWYYNPAGSGWLQTFGGGLLTSCGLTNVGAAGVVDGIEIGLHGRLSHLAARDVTVHRRWIGDRHVIEVGGVVRDTVAMGTAFELHRCYRFVLGENRLEIDDEISNIGGAPAPLFLLYHFNIGHPLLSETTEFDVDPAPRRTEVRNPEQQGDVAAWREMTAPVAGAVERVFYHHIDGDAAAMTTVRVANRIGDGRLSFRLTFPSALGHLVEWKMLGLRDYVLGVEPGNAFVAGRDAIIAGGDAETLAPGAVKRVSLALDFALEPAEEA